MLGGAPDQTGTYHDVALVEDGRLAGCDAVARRVELEAKPARRRRDQRRDGVGAVPKLRVRTGDRDVQPPGSVDPAAAQRATRADDDRVRARVGAEDVQRLRSRDAEPLPLAGREPPVA